MVAVNTRGLPPRPPPTFTLPAPSLPPLSVQPAHSQALRTVLQVEAPPSVPLGAFLFSRLLHSSPHPAQLSSLSPGKGNCGFETHCMAMSTCAWESKASWRSLMWPLLEAARALKQREPEVWAVGWARGGFAAMQGSVESSPGPRWLCGLGWSPNLPDRWCPDFWLLRVSWG